MGKSIGFLAQKRNILKLWQWPSWASLCEEQRAAMVLMRDLFPTGPSPGCFSASSHFHPKASQRSWRTWRKTSREVAQFPSSTLSGAQSSLGSSETQPEGDPQTPPAFYPHTKGPTWTLHQPAPFSWPMCPNHCTPSSPSQGEPAGFSFHFHPRPSWPEDNPHPRTGFKTGSAGCQGVLLD